MLHRNMVGLATDTTLHAHDRNNGESRRSDQYMKGEGIIHKRDRRTEGDLDGRKGKRLIGRQVTGKIGLAKIDVRMVVFRFKQRQRRRHSD